MATSRLADRRIREAATQAALRLDVRGPVSEALGKAGVVVPPAAETPEAAPPASASPRPPSRRRGLTPTVKPFAETPWPTRRALAEAPVPLTGLTADERRVHRILVDTLDVATEQESGLGGLTFGDRKKLEALDLAFIDAQLAGNARRNSTTLTLGPVAVVTLFVAATVVGIVGNTVLAFVLAAAAVLGAVQLVGSGAGGGATGQRRRILRALRELAVLAHADGATSDALLQADALIDTLADADLGRSHAAAPARRVRS